MKQKFTDAEIDVLAKLHCHKRLTLRDHFTLEQMYKDHGPKSVSMAMRNASGELAHINKKLAQAIKKRQNQNAE